MRQISLSQFTKEKRRYLPRAYAGPSSPTVKRVQKIIDAVCAHGDKALCRFALEFDRAKLTPAQLKVRAEEVATAYQRISPQLIKSLKEVAKRIRKVHTAQLPKEQQIEQTSNTTIRLVYKPLESIGIYVPGGKAAYPSTVLMLAIPAKVAGVKNIIACTPPSQDGTVNPAVLVALNIAGVTEICKIGGAQAIAAMAYGTETVPKVAKIFGPGNIFVQTAKRLVSSQVGVDLTAGPSEIVIFADGTAKTEHIIHDLIAQAEHDEAAIAILVTTSEKLADDVSQRISDIAKEADRAEIIQKALSKNGAILLVKSTREAIQFINQLAPEHVELLTENADELADRIRYAGSVSVGPYTPVAATDYAIGVNHVLPTGGSAKYASALTIFDFMRCMSIQKLSRKGLERLSSTIVTIAEAEGLQAHAKSVMVRLR